MYKRRIGRMPDIVLALTTLPADVDAVPIARELIEAGLAACVSVVPAVRSVYAWQGAVEVGQEQQLVIKTTRVKVDAVWEVLRARHPYDVPEFLVVPVAGGSPDYLNWIRAVVA
jgi:periplasmic divalent cation tolerance protein